MRSLIPVTYKLWASLLFCLDLTQRHGPKYHADDSGLPCSSLELAPKLQIQIFSCLNRSQPERILMKVSDAPSPK